MRTGQFLIRLAAPLVPGPDREEWMAEWTAELWHVHRVSPGQAIPFTLGAFRDALWLRRHTDSNWFHSPWRCALLLLALAAIAVLAAGPGAIQRQSGSPHLLILGIAVVLLPATTSMQCVEYPAGVASLRRRAFLAGKLALVLVIVFCGTVFLASFLCASQVQAHGTLIGYILGLRWALRDQQNRCPECLRRLTNPTPIGTAAQPLLEWYGTELICPNGHGLLHVPQTHAASYSAKNWLRLDASWSGLFSGKRAG